MFGKLKEKLKGALSLFSRKAEEEVKVAEEVIEGVEETPRKEIEKKEVRKEVKGEKIIEKKKEKIVEGKEVKKEKPKKQKDSVLIFHGWEDNSQSGFIPDLKKYLNQNDYDAKSFDQPDTDKPQFEEWFSFAEKKINEANKDQLHLVGHSMGGLLSLKLAEKYKLKKLILVAPVGSRPSKDYFTQFKNKLNTEELEIFKKYQDQSLDIKKIKSNAAEIAFVFGLKDQWVTDEIRDFYVTSFRDMAEMHFFPEYAHMSQSESVKELPILKELFERELQPGIIEHKEIKKEIEKKKQEETLVEVKKEKPKIIEEKKEELTKKEIILKEKKTEKIKEEIREEKSIEEKPKEQIIEKIEKEIPEKKGFFKRITEAITTKTISAEKFDGLFWDLEVALLENNVSVEVIEKIKEDLKAELVDKPLPRDVPHKIQETLKNTLTRILSFDDINLISRIKQKKPLVIAFFGINGAGKTTSIAKLAHYLQQNKISVVLAACDTFRAAAIQQLEEHALKLGVKMIKQDYGSDAAAVAFDAIKYAEKNKVDVVLIDTAGRLHSNVNLMAELEKIIRVTKPDMKLFVGESITGNDCIEQARQFNELVEMDGVILTKADVDEKGGAPLSISYTIKKPILFLGVGQKYTDFEKFNADVILERLGL